MTRLNVGPKVRAFRTRLVGGESHGTADRTIPFASGEKLFRSANEPKTFVAIPGAGHNNWLTPEYLRRLDEFINRVKLDAK